MTDHEQQTPTHTDPTTGVQYYWNASEQQWKPIENQPPRRKRRLGRWIALGAGVLLAVGIVASAATSSGGNAKHTASPTTHATTVSPTLGTASPNVSVSTDAVAPPKPRYTVAQQNAIESARSYLDYSGFSRAGLIQQLTSKYGEGYKMTDAVFAVNHIKVNWNQEAVESARAYLDMTSFSRAGLIQQLTSKYGEQFTLAQATYAADHVGLR
jgi:hypothetical protein